jgi:hypothetical protein
MGDGILKSRGCQWIQLLFNFCCQQAG